MCIYVSLYIYFKEKTKANQSEKNLLVVIMKG